MPEWRWLMNFLINIRRGGLWVAVIWKLLASYIVTPCTSEQIAGVGCALHAPTSFRCWLEWARLGEAYATKRLDVR